MAFGRYLRNAKNFIRHDITLEPVIFGSLFTWFLVEGSQMTTNLLITKICQIELQFDEDFCKKVISKENMTDLEKDNEAIVQSRVNNFEMIGSWFYFTPGVIYSLFAGALVDKFGRFKLLVFFPIFGTMLTRIIMLINYAFLDKLPVEMFHLRSISSIFGGTSIYYLGYYGYGAAISTPEERAYRMAIFDGSEQAGLLFGSIVSPIANEYLGPYGCYTTGIVSYTLVLLYLIFMVKAVPKPKTTSLNSRVSVIVTDCSIKDSKLDSKTENNLQAIQDGYEENDRRNVSSSVCSSGERMLSSVLSNVSKSFRRMTSFLYRYMIHTCMEMCKTIFKPRHNNLRFLLFLQIFIYALYWFALNENSTQYLYMLKVFDGFNGASFAHFMIVCRIFAIGNLFIVMPIMSKKMSLSEPMMLVVILSFETISHFSSVFVTELWQFYLTQIVGACMICKFSVARSMLSKCVNKNEVGKIYSVLAITGSVMPLGGDPAFRQLYGLTLSTLPRAVLLMAGCVSFVCIICNLYIFTQKEKMEPPIISESDKISDPNEDEGFYESMKDKANMAPRGSILSLR